MSGLALEVAVISGRSVPLHSSCLARSLPCRTANLKPHWLVDSCGRARCAICPRQGLSGNSGHGICPKHVFYWFLLEVLPRKPKGAASLRTFFVLPEAAVGGVRPRGSHAAARAYRSMTYVVEEGVGHRGRRSAVQEPRKMGKQWSGISAGAHNESKTRTRFPQLWKSASHVMPERIENVALQPVMCV